MPQRFTEIILVGLVANLLAALALVPLGFLLFSKAFPMLWWNEGRSGMAEQAEAAPVADAWAPERHEGQFVNVEGPLGASSGAVDIQFLDEGPWLAILRHVETYAWNERVETRKKRLIGGRTEVETEWHYELDWTPDVRPPEAMRFPDGHENPPPRFHRALAQAEEPVIGATPFVLEAALGVPWQPLALDDPDVRLIEDALEGTVYGDAIYFGISTPAEPGLGDQVVRFYVLPRDAQVSAFGRISGGLLQEHQWKDGLPLLVALPGTREDAIGLLRAQDRLLTWVFRAGGILAIWGGLMLMLSPLFALFDILPPLGTVLRVVVGILLIPPSLLLGLVPIGLSQFIHSTPALIIVGSCILYLVWARWRMHRDGLLA